MVVPISAVVRSPANLNGFAVFVTEGPGDMVKVQTRDITLGNTYGNMIAVESGLQLGERVITSGTNVIKNGDQVRIIP
jgi:multidrug efflux pump subunit AcrA (membrane-fusion protein)